MTKRAFVVVTAGLALFAWNAPLLAQTDVGPKACSPHEQSTVGSGGEGALPRDPSRRGTAQDDNLSDKLAASNGVICPPGNVDPAIKAPAPGGGRTPVIPPPDTSGGNPDVRPK